jgi:hypothetical protein
MRGQATKDDPYLRRGQADDPIRSATRAGGRQTTE